MTAFYMIKKYSGKTNREVGDIFGGMHYSSVNRAKERLEKKMQVDKKLREKVSRVESNIKA